MSVKYIKQFFEYFDLAKICGNYFGIKKNRSRLIVNFTFKFLFWWSGRGLRKPLRLCLLGPPVPGS